VRVCVSYTSAHSMPNEATLKGWQLAVAVEGWVEIMRRLRAFSDERASAVGEESMHDADAHEARFEAYVRQLQEALPSETFDKQVHEVVDGAIRAAREVGIRGKPLVARLQLLLQQVHEQEDWMEKSIQALERRAVLVVA